MEDTEIFPLIVSHALQIWKTTSTGTLETNLANNAFCAEDMKFIPICLRMFTMDDP